MDSRTRFTSFVSSLIVLLAGLVAASPQTHAEVVKSEPFVLGSEDPVNYSWSGQGTLALLGQKKCADNEPMLLEGYQGLKSREAKIPAPRKDSLTWAAAQIVNLYEAWSKPEKAAAWKGKLGLTDLPAEVFARP